MDMELVPTLILYILLVIAGYGLLYLVFWMVCPTIITEGLFRPVRESYWWLTDFRQPKAIRERRKRLWLGYNYALAYLASLELVREMFSPSAKLKPEENRKLAQMMNLQAARNAAIKAVTDFFGQLTEVDLELLAEAVWRYNHGKRKRTREEIAAFIRDEQKIVATDKARAESHLKRAEQLVEGKVSLQTVLG